MAVIGSMGKIAFVVTQEKMRTFTEFTRNNAPRFATHEIINKKPKQQFLGPGIDTVTFTIMFTVMMKMNPRKEMDALVEMERSGKAFPLTIGGKRVGTNLFVITQLSQAWNTFDSKGHILTSSVNITLGEYAR